MNDNEKDKAIVALAENLIATVECEPDDIGWGAVYMLLGWKLGDFIIAQNWITHRELLGKSGWMAEEIDEAVDRIIDNLKRRFRDERN